MIARHFLQTDHLLCWITMSDHDNAIKRMILIKTESVIQTVIQYVFHFQSPLFIFPARPWVRGCRCWLSRYRCVYSIHVFLSGVRTRNKALVYDNKNPLNDDYPYLVKSFLLTYDWLIQLYLLWFSCSLDICQ
jgi:hypothetical protein